MSRSSFHFGTLELAAVAFAGVVGSSCTSEPARPVIPFDGSSIDSGPRDSGTSDMGTDLGADSSVDSGSADAGTVVGCTAGTPAELFQTAYLVGYQVPYGASANVDGLLVAATVITEANYPFYDRIAGYMSQTGGVSAPTNVSASAMVMSDSIAVSTRDNGFLVLFDETPSLGMPTDLWTRTADLNGVFMGSAATQLTTTASAGESGARLARTTSGFAAAWNESGTGPMTAVLDTNGAIVGTSHSASASIGMPGSLELYSIAGAPYAAYFGSDQKVHAVAVASDGTVSGTPLTLSASTTTGNFSVGGGASGAGLAYELPKSGGKTSLQFRTINADGNVTLAERTLTALDEQGQRPSVASLAGGYLILYRSIPATGNPSLRLAFVTGTGDAIGSITLVDSFPAEPRFSLHVSPDGEVYVVYHEAIVLGADGGLGLNGASVRAIRIVCE